MFEFVSKVMNILAKTCTNITTHIHHPLSAFYPRNSKESPLGQPVGALISESFHSLH